MRDYRNITIWQNVSRLDKLVAFRNALIAHSNASFDYSKLHGDEEKARKREEMVKYRVKVNRNLLEVGEIVSAAGAGNEISYYVTHALSEYGSHSDAVRAVDLLDQAIGVYEGDRTSAIIRSYNPFWWAFQILQWFSRIPFILISGAGFNTARIENSLAGRLIKLAFLALPALYALKQILEDLNFW